MKGVIPAIVTHPCTLFRDGLFQILTGTRFRPVHMAAQLDDESLKQLAAAGTCVWILGLERCDAGTYDLVRRVTADAPGVKTVILAQHQTANDVLPALESGSSGFLYQDISRERLIKSLELIMLGETVVPSDFFHAVRGQLGGVASVSPQPQSAETPGVAPRTSPVDHASAVDHAPRETSSNGSVVNGNGSTTASTTADNGTASDGAIVRGLSRREASILRMLMEGGSNKVIARQLVITEATVKVHIKAILRKLRLHNRTQAAMWAYNHLGDDHGDEQNGVAIVPMVVSETYKPGAH